MAAYAIQFRRGTTTQHNSFTGLLGEITVDTDKKTVVVHDGSNAGGTALALEGAAISTTTGAFSSNVTIGGTLGVTGMITGNVTGNLTGNSAGVHTGNVTGDLTGNSAGVHTGNVTGNLTGNSAGVHTGAVTGDVTGNITGNSAGIHTGALVGSTGSFSGNVTMAGNLTVSGSTTYLSTEAITLNDNIFMVNSNQTGAPTENGGFEVERGDLTNVQFVWNETDDRWTVGSATLHAGAMATPMLTGDVTGDLTGDSAGTHTGAVTGNVTGNTSGSAGTVTSIAAHLKDEDNMASNSATHVASQQSIKAYVDASILTKDNTDEITEGSTNLYFTNARSRAAISVSGDMSYNSSTGVISTTGLASSDTDDLSEGSSNLYWTNARGDARITNALKDEDNMASNSATHVASQQSIKAYVDAVSAAFAAADSADATAWAAADTADAIAWAAADAAQTSSINTAWAAADTAQTTAINTAWAAADTAQTTALQSYADQAEADAESAAATDATTKADAAQAAAISAAATTAESKDAVRATAANAYADAAVAVLTAGASASLDTLLEIANVMATDAELSSAIGALNHDSLSGFVADEHIDWTGDRGATNIHASNYTNTTYSVGDGGLTQVNFTTADNTKLDGIEASADITDTANVTSAGALMDSELTGIAHVKSLNQALTTTSSPSFTAVTAATLNGTATYALYADLAERYAADATYEEGTVLAFGGEAEVTSAQGYGSTKIAGVVSLNPGFAMNSEAGNSETHPYIALQGRVPTKVMGTVSKGDVLVASEVSGIATVWTDSTIDPRMTAYVGIAIEDKTTDAVGFIEVKVGK